MKSVIKNLNIQIMLLCALSTVSAYAARGLGGQKEKSRLDGVSNDVSIQAIKVYVLMDILLTH